MDPNCVQSGWVHFHFPGGISLKFLSVGNRNYWTQYTIDNRLGLMLDLLSCLVLYEYCSTPHWRGKASAQCPDPRTSVCTVTDPGWSPTLFLKKSVTLTCSQGCCLINTEPPALRDFRTTE